MSRDENRPQTRLRLPGFPNEEKFSHEELCWLVRRLIGWRIANLREDDWRQMLTRLEDKVIAAAAARGVGRFVRVVGDTRRQNMLTNGFALLKDPELELLRYAVTDILLVEVPSDQVKDLADAVRRKASLLTQTYATILGLSRGGKGQAALRDLVGDYLIFRRVFNPRLFVASHMTVSQDGQARFPAEFETTSQSTDAKVDFSRVQGIMYIPDEQLGETKLIYTVGKQIETTQIRSTILETTHKRVPNRSELPKDLFGIRLGIGRRSLEPLGYRIWCSRLGAKPPDGWAPLAREYELEAEGADIRLADMPGFQKRYGCPPHTFFTRHIDGFDHIFQWLNNPVFAELHHQGDPDDFGPPGG